MEVIWMFKIISESKKNRLSVKRVYLKLLILLTWLYLMLYLYRVFYFSDFILIDLEFC